MAIWLFEFAREGTMKRTVWLVGIAVAGMFAWGQGCGSTSGGSGGKGGTGGTATCQGCGGADGAIWEPSCMDCACAFVSGDVPAGCADTCDNTISGAANPNFCNGASALTQCSQCIMDRCGESAANCL
jgi:hypothetical protein